MFSNRSAQVYMLMIDMVVINLVIGPDYYLLLCDYDTFDIFDKTGPLLVARKLKASKAPRSSIPSQGALQLPE